MTALITLAPAAVHAQQVVKQGTTDTYHPYTAGEPVLVSASVAVLDNGAVSLSARYAEGTDLGTTFTQWGLNLDGKTATGFTFLGASGIDSIWNAYGSDFAATNRTGATYSYDTASETVTALLSPGEFDFTGDNGNFYAVSSFQFTDTTTSGVVVMGTGNITSAVPEPANIALMALGLGALGLQRRRAQRPSGR